MKWTLIAVLAPLVAFGDFQTRLTMENDTFLKKDDSDYTHGTKFEVIDQERGFHYMLQQTMYAPPDLSLNHHVPGDRPYAGMLIGGVGYEFWRDKESPWTNYGELDFGVIGPAAGCKETQTFIHKILHCHKPMGWDDQLHNEVVVNGQWWTKYNWMPTSWLALVPKVGVAAGNIEDFGEIGVDLKLGYNIQRTPANEIMFSMPAPRGGQSWRDKLSAYGYVGASERFYLYNHMLEGSMFNHKDDKLKVDIERFVTEARVGAVVSYDRFYIMYYAVFRTYEYRHQKNHPDYGGIGLGWTF